MRRIAFIIFWVVLLPGLAWGHVRLEAASRLKTGFVDSLIYSYDQLNRLSNAVDSAVGTAIYGYDEVGNVKTTVYPSGVTNTYTYDALNRLTDLAGTTNNGTLASFKYKLGAAGNRTSLVETVKALNRTNNWFYDALYRLTNEVLIGAAPAGTNSYRYDAVGNRTNRTVVATGLTNQNFTYNTNDWLTGDVYDSNGSTRTNGPNIFFYDAENHLTNATVAGTTVAYAYTADGIRVSKTIAGTTTLYLVDDRNPSGYAQVLEELAVTGGTTNLSKVFTYGLDLIAQRDAGTGTRSFYGYDGNGNTRYLTGTNGAITDTYLCDAFGSLLTSTGTTANDYRYTGEQYDTTLGLYYLRARYLNAGTGRFWSRDGVPGAPFDPASLHRYTYGANNPANRVDPSGNEFTISGIYYAVSAQLYLASIQYAAVINVVRVAAGVAALAAFVADTDFRGIYMSVGGNPIAEAQFLVGETRAVAVRVFAAGAARAQATATTTAKLVTKLEELDVVVGLVRNNKTIDMVKLGEDPFTAMSHEKLAERAGVLIERGSLQEGVEAFTVVKQQGQIRIRGSNNFNVEVSDVTRNFLMSLFE